MDKIELRRIGSLHLHPDNVAIFGLPTDESNYEEIREDIKRRGLQEPLIILADGTILSGHIRFASVCWSLEQEGLTQEEILEQVIAVRVHEDFETKEEELEYLMSANEKRRQLDPRRIASSYEKLVQVIEDRLGGKKGKKSEALQGLADRLGTSHKLAKSYFTIFSSKVVPDEVKDKVNTKDLSPTAVLEALKFAEDSAKRESRAPSMADVDAYVKHPRAKTSLADTVRQVAKVSTTIMGTMAPSPSSTPKADPKPVTVEVVAEPPKTTQPEPEVVTPEPEPIVVTSDPVVEPEPTQERNVHTSHCCLEHGCKYSDSDCPVANGSQKQEGSCEFCGLISEGYFDQDSGEQGVDIDECQDGPSPMARICTARRLLKEALGVIVLDPSSTSELLGLHTELTSYLLAMEVLKPSVEFKLPTTSIGQLQLANSLIRAAEDDVEDPQTVRDILLELVSFAKPHIDRLSTTKRGFDLTGLYCPECLSKQYNTPSGVACENGHGGLDGISEAQATAIRISQAVTDSKVKCTLCGSQVETAKDATHASCPKCGLVDTSDIEPVEDNLPSNLTSAEPKKDDILLSAADLADLLEPTPKVTHPIDLHTELPLSSMKLEPLSPTKKEEYKKVLEETKVSEPKKEEPKATPVAQATKVEASTEDPEADLVSSVIDDFMNEIEKAGGIPATA